MKNAALVILRYLLKKLAQLTLWRYRPGVIGITGSVGKTSTKFAIGAVLASDRHVRIASGNFNNELGLPLAILGDWDRIGGWFFWPRVLVVGLWRIVVRAPYPELLVLEYGIDRPGDMRRLIEIARPGIVVMTAIGAIPAHVEFFGSPADVVREKARLIESLPVAGYAILDHDSEVVQDLRERTRAHVMSYGFDRTAEVRVANFTVLASGMEPVGIAFELVYGLEYVRVELPHVLGRAQASAVAAAACVGIVFGVPLPKIAEALRAYRPPAGRMTVRAGVKPETWVVDDAYNANPASMNAALQTLVSLPGKRKIAVLGDMLEIGPFAEAAHEAVGKLASRSATLLVTVGPRAKFIAEGARAAGMAKRNILSFDTADEAHPKVQDLMRKGDLVLVKGSHAMRLHELVEEIIAHPDKPED